MRALATAALACGLSLQLTPRMARAARALGIVDAPDGRLKLQRAPVPYLGGMAVFLATLLATSALGPNGRAQLAIVLGATLLTMLGLFDDLHAMTPGHKLLGQGVGGYVLLRAGVAVHLVDVPAPLAVAGTLLWLLSVTNAVNLIDVSDGFAAGSCVGPCVGLAALALLGGDVAAACLASALGGSLVAFYRFNRAPAQVYLGDCGALFVGFGLAALALQARYTQLHPWGAACPLVLLSVPLLDLVTVTLARAFRGHSPLTGSPDHVALLLRRAGVSVAGAARGASAVSLGCAALAVAIARLDAPVAKVLIGAWAATFAAATAWFVAAAQARYAADVGARAQKNGRPPHQRGTPARRPQNAGVHFSGWR